MKSSEYWQKRFELIESASHRDAMKVYREIERTFYKMQKELQDDINAWLVRIADNNKVSMLEARKLLNNKELAEFKWDVNEYIKYGMENAINQKWMKQLENASARFHISRLEAVKIKTQNAMEKAFGNETDAVDEMARRIYSQDYFHTAFEIRKGLGVGWDVSAIDERKLSTLISKPWAVDGKNFSDRIWEQKGQMINRLHDELVRICILGKAPDEAINHMMEFVKSNVKNARSRASALVQTEQAFFSSAAQKDCFNELDVEQFEVVAVLDSKTSQICRDMDGKLFNMKDFKPGITAPPFHVNCRSTTAPYFDDDFGEVGERVATGEDGKSYYVPADMTYREWEQKYVKDAGNELKNGSGDGIMKNKVGLMSLEYQRYGRNKQTLVNSTYINSGEYRNKFDRITDNKDVARSLYSKAKEMLEHRSGTLFEDMYWIDGKTGETICKVVEGNTEQRIDYSDSILKAIRGRKNVITLHTHPSSMPPSIDDFNSAFSHNYKTNLIICHDGKVYVYSSNQRVEPTLWEIYVRENIDNGLSEKDAQLKALKEIHRNYSIYFEEVKENERL